MIIFAALPYGNGPLHFGRVGGSLLPADILTRYYRLKGQKVWFVSGTDCYGTPIMYAAERLNKPYEVFVKEWHERFSKTLALWHIRLDTYSLTHNSVHRKKVSEYVNLLAPSKVVEATLYCETCKKLIFTRYFQAACPYCNALTNSQLCENCGKESEVSALLAPTCRACNTPLVISDAENYVLDLSKHHKAISEHFIKPFEKSIIDSFYECNHPFKAILRPIPWGVPTALLPNHVYYVWIQALLGYLSMSEAYVSDTPSTHFIGIDNFFYHSVVYGNMLKSLGKPLPVVNTRRWFLLAEAKQSSSRAHYLDLYELTLSVMARDVCRAYLASKDTLHKESSLSLQEFGTFYEMFVKKIHNLYYRTYSYACSRGVLDICFQSYDARPDELYDRLMQKSELAKVWEYLLTKISGFNKQFQEFYASWSEAQLSRFVNEISYNLQLFKPLCPRYYGQWVNLYDFHRVADSVKGTIKPPLRLTNDVIL